MIQRIVKRTITITAIHDSDLERVLRKLGLYENLVAGELTCFICERKVSLENLGGLLRINDKVKVVCDDPRCLLTAREISASLSKSRA